MILLIKNPAYNSRFLAGRFLELFESPDVQYRREPQNIPSCRKWLRMLCGAQPISTVERRYSLLIRHSAFSVVIYPADSSGFWCKLRMRFGWMAIKAGMTAGITAPDLFKAGITTGRSSCCVCAGISGLN